METNKFKEYIDKFRNFIDSLSDEDLKLVEDIITFSKTERRRKRLLSRDYSKAHNKHLRRILGIK